MNITYTNNINIQKLEQEYKQLKLDRNELRHNLEKMIDDINKINPQFFGQALADSGHVQKTPEQNAALAEQKKEDNKALYKESSNLKDMWRKIAATCHPDKTHDVWRHEIYKLAGEAKTNLDEDAMAHLYVQLSSEQLNVSHHSLVSELITNLKIEITRLKSSKLYKLFLMRTANKVLFFYTINSQKP